MFAINHAATALVLRKAFPEVRMLWLLLSVQAVEMLWVLLNWIGIERTFTDPVVRSLANIHLADMPWSHSIAMSVIIALIGAALAFWGLGSRRAAVAVGIGILSHIVLDLLVHAPDIAITPAAGSPEIGTGLYVSAPLAAFALETAYGIGCWWVFGGGTALLVVIVLFNLANLTMFASALPGLEGLLAGRPQAIVTLVAVQIAVTLWLVGRYAVRPAPAHA